MFAATPIYYYYCKLILCFAVSKATNSKFSMFINCEYAFPLSALLLRCIVSNDDDPCRISGR